MKLAASINALSISALLGAGSVSAEVIHPEYVTVQLLVCSPEKERSIPECSTQAAIQGEATKLISFYDYPARANRQQRGGVVYFRLLADTSKPLKGLPANGYGAGDCRIARSSGHEDLDKETCKLLKRRVTFSAESVDSTRTGVDGRVIWVPSWKVQPDFPVYPQPSTIDFKK